MLVQCSTIWRQSDENPRDSIPCVGYGKSTTERSGMTGSPTRSKSWEDRALARDSAAAVKRIEPVNAIKLQGFGLAFFLCRRVPCPRRARSSRCWQRTKAARRRKVRFPPQIDRHCPANIADATASWVASPIRSGHRLARSDPSWVSSAHLQSLVVLGGQVEDISQIRNSRLSRRRSCCRGGAAGARSGIEAGSRSALAHA